MKRNAFMSAALLVILLACGTSQQVQDALVGTYVAQTAQAAAPLNTPTPEPTATFPPPPGGGGSILPGEADNLACFLTDGGVTCLTDGGWFDPLAGHPSLDGDEVADIAQCDSGTLLFVYSGGVSAYAGGQWSDHPSGGYWSWPHAACAPDGTIWVAHGDGLSRYDAAGWTTQPGFEPEGGIGIVKGVVVSPDGLVWVANNDSLLRFDGQAWQTFTTGQGWTENFYFNGLVINSAGAVVATTSDHLLAFYNEEWNSLAGPSELDIEALFLDASDTIWVGTDGGVAQFNWDPTRIGGYDAFPQSPKPPAWILWDIPSVVVSSRNVQSLAVDQGGRVWLGTEWGLLIFDGAAWTAFHMHTADLAGNQIEDLAVLGRGPVLPGLVEKATGGLRGRLLRNGAPIAGAMVEICVEGLGIIFFGYTPCSAQPFIRMTTTDADGAFEVGELPPGRYVLTFQEQPGGDWTRLTSFLSDRWFLVEPGQVTQIEDVDVGEE